MDDLSPEDLAIETAKSTPGTYRRRLKPPAGSSNHVGVPPLGDTRRTQCFAASAILLLFSSPVAVAKMPPPSPESLAGMSVRIVALWPLSPTRLRVGDPFLIEVAYENLTDRSVTLFVLPHDGEFPMVSSMSHGSPKYEVGARGRFQGFVIYEEPTGVPFVAIQVVDAPVEPWLAIVYENSHFQHRSMAGAWLKERRRWASHSASRS